MSYENKRGRFKGFCETLPFNEDLSQISLNFEAESDVTPENYFLLYYLLY